MTNKFVVGALYRVLNMDLDIMPFDGQAIDPTQEIPVGDHIVFLEPAPEGRVAQLWYWVEGQRKVKVIVSNMMFEIMLEMISLPD